ncbi:MAG: hypothetical protein E7497_05650 [Ruminococcus sp.]|nr:hypothetical protein [Ruminococcus sp.]
MSKRTRKIKHKINKKVFISIAAAAVVAFGSTAAIAAKQYGVFEKLKANKEKTTVLEDGREIPNLDMKYDNDNYGNIAEHAQPADEAVKEETIKLSGLQVDVESVYCDGRNLVIGITGSLTDGNPDGVSYIGLGTELIIDGVKYTSDLKYGDCIRFDSLLLLDEGAENDFTGSIKVTFKDHNKLTKATTANIKLYNTVGLEEWYDHDSIDRLENPLELSVDIIPDTSLTEETDISVSDNGFKAKIYEITPDSIIIGTDYPTGYGTIETYCVDENGEKIPFIPMYSQPDYGDGMHTFICSNTNPSEITVIWISKNGDGIIHEYTFELSE